MSSAPCPLLLFAKAPVPGEVKTRLIPCLGAEEAARLSAQLTLHALSVAKKSNVAPVELWCAPSTGHPFFRQCAEEFQVPLKAQPTGNLGQRMAKAFQKTLRQASMALLMGTDCPSLTQHDLNEAASLLHTVDVVMTPTEDGGYALIGLRRFSSALFEDIPWGTERVLGATRLRLRELEWHWHELPTRWDVDRPEDVKRLSSDGPLSYPLREK